MRDRTTHSLSLEMNDRSVVRKDFFIECWLLEEWSD